MKNSCLDKYPTAVDHLLFNHSICIRLKLQFFPYARIQIRLRGRGVGERVHVGSGQW